MPPSPYPAQNISSNTSPLYHNRWLHVSVSMYGTLACCRFSGSGAINKNRNFQLKCGASRHCITFLSENVEIREGRLKIQGCQPLRISWGVRYHFLMILPLKNNQIELTYLKNYLKGLDMSPSLTHRNPTGVTPIAFD